MKSIFKCTKEHIKLIRLRSFGIDWYKPHYSLPFSAGNEKTEEQELNRLMNVGRWIGDGITEDDIFSGKYVLSEGQKTKYRNLWNQSKTAAHICLFFGNIKEGWYSKKESGMWKYHWIFKPSFDEKTFESGKKAYDVDLNTDYREYDGFSHGKPLRGEI